jgi:hypothetical protein
LPGARAQCTLYTYAAFPPYSAPVSGGEGMRGISVGRSAARQRGCVCQVITRPAVEAHLAPVLTGDDPEAVVFDFMQPQRPGRRMLGFCGQARRDEPGREGTLQHASLNTAGGASSASVSLNLKVFLHRCGKHFGILPFQPVVHSETRDNPLTGQSVELRSFFRMGIVGSREIGGF